MSRRLVLFAAVALSLPQIAAAQAEPTFDIPALIKKSEKIYEDLKSCPDPEDGEEIVVCAAPEKEKMVFEKDESDKDRIRRGEAVSTEKAAACIVNCWNWLPPTVSVPFGYVPPPAISLEEVMKGLAEPENVVREGSVDAAGRAIDEAPIPNPAPNP